MSSEDALMAQLRSKPRKVKGATIEERKVLETRGRRSIDGRVGRVRKSVVTVQLNMRVSEELKELITEASKRRGITMADYVADAVAAFEGLEAESTS